MKDSKDLQNTVLEIVHHLCISHPELASSMEKIIFRAQGKKLFDANLLLTLHANLLSKSTSQIRQDLFVLHELGFKREGFFVEFGATNGIELSNTYILEKEYNWKGILAEPAKIWHSDLLKNRNVSIDKRCVWKNSEQSIYFNETKIPTLSTIDSISDNDTHAKARQDGTRYPVSTVSLLDLLKYHNAPKEIDYMSIDTEGSEYDILENFDFNQYRIKVITCEHNYSATRDKLRSLFVKNGYEQRYPKLSQFDDWWVLK